MVITEIMFEEDMKIWSHVCRWRMNKEKKSNTATICLRSTQKMNIYTFFMVALCNRVDHIYIFVPVSFFFLSFFISSPNLSGHRLDVYHTQKCRKKIAIWAPSHNFVGLYLCD